MWIDYIYVKSNNCMPKWKKDSNEFTVGISYSDTRGTQSYIPKPIIDFLGEPESLKFIIKGKIVQVIAGKK